MPRRLSISHLAKFAVCGYEITVICLWMAVELFADRAWPATLIAYGPRWPVALPLLPLVALALAATPRRLASKLIGLLVLTGFVLVLGFMDFRLGLGRTSGRPTLRIMTQNLGAGQVTAEALDRFLRAENIDVAAIQECPFYDYSIARYGWHFYYGGDLCLVSRFPFAVMDVANPENVWRKADGEPMRFEIDGPMGRFQLLNVHLPTIREGLEALGMRGWRGLHHFVSNRDESMQKSRAARQRTTRATHPLVIAGDFNLPVESTIYRANWGDLSETHFRCAGVGSDTRKRQGCLRSGSIMCSRPNIGAARRLASSLARTGGDHAPLVVDLVPRQLNSMRAERESYQNSV